MAQENLYDVVLSRTLKRVESVSGRIAKNFKGVNPFDKEKVAPKEALLDFEDMMSREPQLRQQFGDNVIEKYKLNMSKFLGGK